MTGVKAINLLLAEENPRYANIIKGMFNKHDKYTFNITCIQELSEVLHYISLKKFDALLLDLGIHNSQALETLAKVRETDPDVPVIVLSGTQDEKLAEEAIKVGADDYLVKDDLNLKSLTRSLIYSIERNSAKLTIRQREERLRAAHEELNSLIYRLSHDMKAPLITISGLVRTAMMEIKEERASEYFHYIAWNSERLLQRMNKLVEIARTKEDISDIIQIQFNDLISLVKDDLQFVEGYKNIRFTICNSNQKPFYSNYSILHSIFQELIENSIQFRRNIEDSFIHIQIIDSSEGVIIEMNDNGSGILPECKNRVFDLFYRGSEKSQGAGIGLYLVKSCIHKIGGQIHLYSKPDTGTFITIKLPCLNHFPSCSPFRY